VKIQPQWIVTPGKQTNITVNTLHKSDDDNDDDDYDNDGDDDNVLRVN
jgi:hypothetical protein